MAIKKTLTGKDFCECPPCEELNAEIYPVTSDDQVILSDNGVELNNWLEVNRNGDHPTTLYDWLRLNYNQSPSVIIPTASTTTLGGVIIDPTYLTISSNGVLGVNANAIPPNINTASFDDLGIIKLGNSTVLPSDFANSTIFDTDVQIFPLRLDSNNRAGISIPNSFFSQVQSDWNQTNTDALDYIKNKPSIPAVSNASIIFRQGGSQIGSITLNQATDTVIDFNSGGGGEGGGTTYYAGTGLNLDNSTFNLKPASTNEIGGIELGYTNNYEESGSTTPASLTLNRKLNTLNNDAYTQLPKILWSDGMDVSFDTTTDALTFKTKVATANELGSIRTGYESSDTSTRNRDYPVQLDENSKAYVHIPWTDTLPTGEGGEPIVYTFNGQNGITATVDNNDVTISLSNATDSTLGGIKIGFTTNNTNRNYALRLSNNQAYVNVPWKEYALTGSNGITIGTSTTSGNVTTIPISVNKASTTSLGVIKTGYSYDDNNRAKFGVNVDNNGQATVNIPIVQGDDSTGTTATYNSNGTTITVGTTAATASNLGTIKIGYPDATAQSRNYPVKLGTSTNANKAYVNVPWSDTTYTADKGLTLDTTTNTFEHSNTASYSGSGTAPDVQNTLAVYPIKIDAYGHITSYGAAVSVSDTKVKQQPQTIDYEYPILLRQHYLNQINNSPEPYNIEAGYARYAYPPASTGSVPTINTSTGVITAHGFKFGTLTSAGAITAPSTPDTYLKYNGTSFEWAAVSGGGSSITYDIQTSFNPTTTTYTRTLLQNNSIKHTTNIRAGNNISFTDYRGAIDNKTDSFTISATTKDDYFTIVVSGCGAPSNANCITYAGSSDNIVIPTESNPYPILIDNAVNTIQNAAQTFAENCFNTDKIAVFNIIMRYYTDDTPDTPHPSLDNDTTYCYSGIKILNCILSAIDVVSSVGKAIIWIESPQALTVPNETTLVFSMDNYRSYGTAWKLLLKAAGSDYEDLLFEITVLHSKYKNNGNGSNWKNIITCDYKYKHVTNATEGDVFQQPQA